MSHESDSDRRRMKDDDKREFAPSARHIRGEKRTGYAIGERVEIVAGSDTAFARGVVAGYGLRKAVRIKRDDMRTLETWPVALIRREIL